MPDVALGAPIAFCIGVHHAGWHLRRGIQVPVQISIPHTPSPAVTPTNLLYSLIAFPGALLRFHREERLAVLEVAPAALTATFLTSIGRSESVWAWAGWPAPTSAPAFRPDNRRTCCGADSASLPSASASATRARHRLASSSAC